MNVNDIVIELHNTARGLEAIGYLKEAKQLREMADSLSSNRERG